MKHILFLLLTFLTVNAYAQKFGYAFKIGGSIASQTTNNKDVINTNSIRTFNIGGIVKYYLPRNWMLQGSINWSNKGGEVVEDAITTTTHISYLDIPVNIAKKFKLTGLGILYAGAGGYYANALKGHYDYQTPNSTSSEKLEFGNHNFLQRTDLGVNFTTGLEIDNGLLFDLRYALGLKNLATQPLKDTGTSTIHNRFFCVSIGYVFK